MVPERGSGAHRHGLGTEQHPPFPAVPQGAAAAAPGQGAEPCTRGHHAEHCGQHAAPQPAERSPCA